MPNTPARGALRRAPQPRHAPAWPAPKVEVLTHLWCAGNLSASQIGRQLGVTRNAVLGKVHRLGLAKDRPARAQPSPAVQRVPRAPRRLPPKPTAIAPSGARTSVGVARSDATRVPPAVAADGAPGASASKAVDDRVSPPAPSLRRGQGRPEIEDELPGLVERLESLGGCSCHWPCGDPKADDFAFCGRRARVGPYCAAHAARAYRPGAASTAELLRLAVRLGA